MTGSIPYNRGMAAPSLVLFDLDETLFDYRHASRMALMDLRRRYPILASAGLDNLQQRARDILERIHDAVVRGRMTTEQARLERVRRLFETCGATPPDGILDRAAEAYGAVYARSRRAVPGAAAVIDALRRHTAVRAVAVATNHLIEVQRDKLDATGLTDRIDFMVTSEEVGSLKPAPVLFDAALARAGVPAAAAVMVGDSWEGDVVGAVGAGMRAVWFNRAGEAMPAGPESAGVRELRAFEPVETACRVILSG